MANETRTMRVEIRADEKDEFCLVGRAVKYGEVSSNQLAPGMRERILAMKALWTQEEAAFHGEMVNFDPVWLYPKPAQRPYPPILLGGSSDHTVKRVVEFCDGWLPIARPGFNAKQAVAQLRQAASAAGRDLSTLTISVFGAPADEAVLAEYREVPARHAHSSRQGIRSLGRPQYEAATITRMGRDQMGSVARSAIERDRRDAGAAQLKAAMFGACQLWRCRRAAQFQTDVSSTTSSRAPCRPCVRRGERLLFQACAAIGSSW